jgi:hypothetical protein
MKAKTVMWVAVAVLALIALGPQVSNWAGRQSSHAAAAATKGAVAAAAGAAGDLCGPEAFDHWCALPANGGRVRPPVTTPPTTIPAPPPPRPYDPANGPVRQLPSQAPPPPPAVAAPPARPQPGEIGTGSPLGALLEAVPVVGPALGPAVISSLRALPPAAP